MTQSVFEQTGEQVADTAHKASRAASAVADAFEDGVRTVRSTARQGKFAAEELLDDTRQHLRRRPIETVMAIFAAGIAAGAAFGWMIKRKQVCDKESAQKKCCNQAPPL